MDFSCFFMWRYDLFSDIFFKKIFRGKLGFFTSGICNSLFFFGAVYAISARRYLLVYRHGELSTSIWLLFNGMCVD